MHGFGCYFLLVEIPVRKANAIPIRDFLCFYLICSLLRHRKIIVQEFIKEDLKQKKPIDSRRQANINNNESD